jgi:hypothetical protein
MCFYKWTSDVEDRRGIRVQSSEGILRRNCRTKKCTGVAGRVQSEVNVTGGNPVILDVKFAEQAQGAHL